MRRIMLKVLAASVLIGFAWGTQPTVRAWESCEDLAEFCYDYSGGQCYGAVAPPLRREPVALCVLLHQLRMVDGV